MLPSTCGALPDSSASSFGVPNDSAFSIRLRPICAGSSPPYETSSSKRRTALRDIELKRRTSHNSSSLLPCAHTSHGQTSLPTDWFTTSSTTGQVPGLVSLKAHLARLTRVTLKIWISTCPFRVSEVLPCPPRERRIRSGTRRGRARPGHRRATGATMTSTSPGGIESDVPHVASGGRSGMVGGRAKSGRT